VLNNEKSYKTKLSEKYLQSFGEENKDIVVFDADLSSSTKTNIFGDKFKDRFFNVGIAEQNMIGMASRNV
jgi:transketolase subunit B